MASTKSDTAENKTTSQKPSPWEKAAEALAGDNQLLSNLLKLLISPFTLLAGVSLIIYLFVKNKQLKDELEKLKKENQELTIEQKSVSEDLGEIQKKYRKIKKLVEFEQAQQLETIQSAAKPTPLIEHKQSKTSYLR